jgi:hypothetical protein
MSVDGPNDSPLVADYALHLRRSSRTLSSYALRFRVAEGPDLLARMATRGRHAYRETLAAARVLASPPRPTTGTHQGKGPV